MNIWVIIKLAFGALGSNKTRASLTLLAIVVGVFAVISASTAVRVIDNYFQETMTLLGSEVINVTTNPLVLTGAHRTHGPRQPLTLRQFEQLQERSRLAHSISPDVVFRTMRVYYDDQSTEPNVQVRGGNEYWIENNAFDVAVGRNLTRDDVADARPFAVIGEDVRKALFDRRDALGERVRIDGQFYTVVGVLEPKGSAFGAAMDNFVMIPYTRLASIYGRERNITLQVRAPSILAINQTADEVTGNLRIIRQVPPGRDNDFDVETNASMQGLFDDFTGVLYLFGLVVGGIALLGAGIGVMNIMLVSVSERTREIGIRKAVGAKPRAIVIQFLSEAVIVCQLGGIIGMVLGIATGNVLSVMMETSFVLPVMAIVSGIVGMTIIGVVFGVYPAWVAARLDPIESLRYE